MKRVACVGILVADVMSPVTVMPGKATTPRRTTRGRVWFSAFSIYLDMVNGRSFQKYDPPKIGGL